MSVSTHRWRPEVGVKSGYTMNRKNRKVRYSKEKTNCQIELKFENSSYFFGAKNPITSVFKESKMSTASLNRFYTFDRMSESSALFNIDKRLTKKLYVSEYVEAKNVTVLTKLKDPFVRGYIISDDKSFVEEVLVLLELIKMKLDTSVWNSYKLIIVPKACDIATEILRRNEAKPKCQHLRMISEDETEDVPYGANEDDEAEDETFTDDTRSTNTTMDEDAEEKLRNKVNTSKFRDSRIILANRPKQLKPEIDPVEKCFLALTKMLEDNIFSAAKGLTEVNAEISNMMKVKHEELLEKISLDSIDVNFQMK